jgi:hypothetical protein
VLRAPTRLAFEAGGQDPTDHHLGAVDIGVRQDDRELVAADPERAIGAAHVGGDRRRGLAQDLVAGGVAAGIVDALEVVEVQDGQRHRPTRPDDHGPLAFHLLLERAVIAETREGVAERLRSGAVVGVLEDPATLLQAFSRLEDAP